ncbi:MAG: hypothetical protein JWO42_1340 [Chloroflexi bacterium]|nr:hypothetical protein [Chloroflexota bacterium]
MPVLLRWCAAGVRSGLLSLLVAILALGVHAGSTAGARPSLLTYTSTLYLYSLSYPATWKLDTHVNSAAVLGKAEAAISPAALRLMAPDGEAVITVLVKQGPTTTAAIKAEEAVLLREHATLVGKISFDTRTIRGLVFCSADATENVSNKGQVERVIFATSHGHFTYYFAGELMLKQKDSTVRGNELVSIFNSIRLTQ